MITSLEPKSGSFILLVGPRDLNGVVLGAVARLGQRTPVRVLDGGNRFNAYTVARAAGGSMEVLERITVSRAFTCYQVLSLLESTPATRTPFIILDLLNTFYDESVQAGERKRLLGACLPHLHRLEREAGGLVSVHPPAVPSQTAIDLLGLLQAATADAYFIQPAPPALEPLRMF